MTPTRFQVIKRDGRTLPFDPQRIKNALRKAYQDVYTNLAPEHETAITGTLNRSVEEITKRFEKEVHIYEIQNVVEHMLLAENPTVAETYINYRTARDLARAKTFDVNHSVNKLLQKDASVINENANKDADVFNTQRDLTAGAVGKAIGLKMLPEHVANAHIKGDIHYHDLDYHPYAPMTNCALVDFEGMLKTGFRIGNAEVEPPRSIQTAAAQITQIIANVASSQYGGCTLNRADELLAKYAQLNYDKHLQDAQKWVSDPQLREEYAREKTRKDIRDAAQSLEYEINTLFTSNGQTPFVSVGFGLGTNWLEKETQKAILQVRIEGLGKEKRTAIFPKLIFTLKKGLNLNPTDPNYDIKQLAVECSTKRMYPDILSYHKIIEITGSFKAPMGCRSFLQGWEDENGNNVVEGRMNLGVVTLNIPRIALEANGNQNTFWELLDQRLETIHDALMFRIERCKEATPANAPVLYTHGAFGKRLKPQDDVNQLFANGRATVSLGYIGLYEAASAFYGGNWETNPTAKTFTLNILKTLNTHAKDWTRRHNYQFSVYSTPSESLTDRFARMDKEKFGIIKNITDKEYYTNSFHYDVRKKPNPFEKLDFEAEYAPLTSGGFIHYCEYPVLEQNPKALEAVWDYAYDKVGYLGTNTPIDHCMLCDFRGDFKATKDGFECPQCGNSNPETSDVTKRVCGYLGNPSVRPWSKGRRLEHLSRVKHMEDLK